MCQNTDIQIEKKESFPNSPSSTSSSNGDVTTASTITTVANEYDNSNTNQIGDTTKTRISPSSNSSSSSSSSIISKTIYTILWLCLTYTSKEFAKYLSIHQSSAAKQTFIPASYQYDDENTFFDNTFLTYGTDYILCIFMLYASYKCYTTHIGLGYKGSALFGFYAISVFCGGVAHSTFLTVESMNDGMNFRLWWMICVGTVTAAGGFMGMCGSELCSILQKENRYATTKHEKKLHSRLFVLEQRFGVGHVRHSLWWFYGIFMTIVCIIGEISYKRPAWYVHGCRHFVVCIMMH